MKALVIGATGATGQYLVDELLNSERYSHISIFVRKATGRQHPKLSEHIISFNEIEKYKGLINGDVLFSCLGSTIKAAGSKEKQWQIDVDIPATFALLAKENGINSFVLVSAYGADAKSKLFYSRMKGELENKIEALQFTQYIIFKPGLLVRNQSNRWGEKAAEKILNLVNKIGWFKKYRPLPASVLAQKLAVAPFIFPNEKTTISLDEIFTL